jgi:uncharacterized protein YjbI with pentapeptide repeats
VASCATVAAVAPQAIAVNHRDLATPSPQETGLLFVQIAPSGTLTPVKAKSNRYVLTLRNVGRQMVWFSDRPARNQGQLPVGSFPGSWKGLGFAADPPNAVLTLLDGDRAADTMVLELRKPTYDAKRRTIRYPARRLAHASGNLASHEPSNDGRVPRRFKDASLFIDDASAPVYYGCVMQPYSICDNTSVEYADLHGLDLNHASWYSPELSGANLSGANLSYSGLDGANAQETNFAGANLNSSSLLGAQLWNANLSGATARNADLRSVTFYNTDLTGADLSGANLGGADLSAVASLANANFTGVNFSGVNLGKYPLWSNTTCPNGTVATAPQSSC